jgi:hypothetical protein
VHFVEKLFVGNLALIPGVSQRYFAHDFADMEHGLRLAKNFGADTPRLVAEEP